MIKRLFILIAVLMMASFASARDLKLEYSLRDTDEDIVFVSTGELNTWSSPYITATGLVNANIQWTNPSGSTINALVPSINFFLSAGTYRVHATDWSRVTRLSLGTSSSGQTYITSIPNMSYLLNNFTGLTTMTYMFGFQTNLLMDITNFVIPTNVTSLSGCFISCTNITGTVPILTNLTKLTTLASAFNYCINITGSYPDISMLTNLTDLSYAFATTKMTGNIPTLSNLVKVTTMDSTFYNNEGGSNSGLVGSIPNLITLTNLTTLRQCFYSKPSLTGDVPNLPVSLLSLETTFAYCYGLTGSIPNLNTLTNLTTMTYTFYNCTNLNGTFPVTLTNMTKLTGGGLINTFCSCSKLTGTLPDISTLTNLTALTYSFFGCLSATGSVPDISGLTKLTAILYAFGSCTNLSGNYPVLNTLTNVTSASYLFSNCNNLTGNMPDISTWTKYNLTFEQMFYSNKKATGSLPNYSPLTNASGSMYAMFANCYNVTGSIPEITTIPNISRFDDAFYNCTNLSGNVDVIFANTNNLKNVFQSQKAFYNNYKLTGSGMRFVNAPKSASYVTNTGTLSSSYQMFYNCTNLSDYATIPAWYK